MQTTTLIRAACAVSTLVCLGCESDRAPAYEGPSPYSADPSPVSVGDTAGNGNVANAGNGAGSADITLLSSNVFDGYLADSEDRALYMFANDIPGSGASACTDGCLEMWPAFDIKDVSVGEGLVAADFARFLRSDGTWQTTFKGHPLYYFAMDGDTGEVTGDGIGSRWFVARDYFAFVGAKADLTPEGASEVAPYLTNRAGRTSYVFMKDTVGSAGASPVSACTDGCLDSWPVWPAPASLDNLILPSDMDATDFDQFERVVGSTAVNQLSYRGWPLYYFAADDLPGETSGHLNGAWRAIDPITFADSGVSITVPGSSY